MNEGNSRGVNVDLNMLNKPGTFLSAHALALYNWLKVESWPIGLYRHPPTKTGRSRRYSKRFSSGLEGGQFMKPFVGWYTFMLWDRY